MNQFSIDHKAFHPSPKNEFIDNFLIVEDHLDVQEIVGLYLKIGGYDFAAVGNGKEAIDYLKTNKVGIIITDLEMPKVDGMELLKHTKENHPGIDVVVMTGYSQKYSFMDVINAGASDFMVKPVQREEFLAKIKRVSRERKLLYEVELQKNNLEKVNNALSVLLEKREQDKVKFEEQVLSQVKQLIRPTLTHLQRSNLTSEQNTLLGILENGLSEITSPFAHTMSGMKFHLTPAEIQIADMVRQGLSSKDIAELMHLSPYTISNHRKKIRLKCGIPQGANLRSYLLSRLK